MAKPQAGRVDGRQRQQPAVSRAVEVLPGRRLRWTLELPCGHTVTRVGTGIQLPPDAFCLYPLPDGRKFTWNMTRAACDYCPVRPMQVDDGMGGVSRLSVPLPFPDHACAEFGLVHLEDNWVPCVTLMRYPRGARLVLAKGRKFIVTRANWRAESLRGA